MQKAVLPAPPCIFCSFRSITARRIPVLQGAKLSHIRPLSASTSLLRAPAKSKLKYGHGNARILLNKERQYQKRLHNGLTKELDASEDDKIFKEAVLDTLKTLGAALRRSDMLLPQLNKPEDFDNAYEKFSSTIIALLSGRKPRNVNLTEKEAKGILLPIYESFRHDEKKTLHKALERQFFRTLRRFNSNKDFETNMADFRFPAEWFPGTRTMQRSVHLHVGPTNSGKTYHALKRLQEAESGIYAAPLRLLAHEIYVRLNSKGVACDLITGDERRMLGDKPAPMQSCTVEMVPINTEVDVAVIDEIQMIGDKIRGWAWTQALLGVRAKEVHLCGEERAIPLIKELVAAAGDTIHIHNYKRLNPLKVMNENLKGLGQLQKGDAIVSFSKVHIHSLRKTIEKRTSRRVAIIYGSLPPEIRAQQAELFNDPNNDYDFLVASNAIGMGLNLSIKRLIFESVVRFDGTKLSLLETSEIKQIAGRAGRYRTAHEDNVQTSPADITDGAEDEGLGKLSKGQRKPKHGEAPRGLGLVTTLEKADLPIVRGSMETEVEPLRCAGLQPPPSAVIRFASTFPPNTPFSYILTRLTDISVINPRFFLCALKEGIIIADTIRHVKGLTPMDRYIFSCAPVGRINNEVTVNALIAFAKCVGEQNSGDILDIPALPLELLDVEPNNAEGYMAKLEALHASLTLYLWLTWRFRGVFTNRALALHIKELTEEKIDITLSQFSSSKRIQKQLNRLVERGAASRADSGLAVKGRDDKEIINSDSHSKPIVPAAVNTIVSEEIQDAMASG
ncbi:MAG: RNA helicase [Cirrosporium novae-zelandiae]|nr:MAG: RNA helicase [Cirrosporium novae-zelandiae]